MNKKTVKIIGVTAACTVAAIGLAACGKKKTEVEPTDSAIQNVATEVTNAIENIETTVASTESAETTETSTETKTVENTEAVEETADKKDEENFDPANLSTNFKDRDVMFDGIHLDMPCDWEVLRKDGWDFKEEIMKQMEIAGGVGTTVKMVNEEKYPGLIVEFSFNNTDEDNNTTKVVPECLITGFNVSAEGDKYPAVTLGGGITWGATRDAVVAVFGEPTETVENEDKTTTLHYEESFIHAMDLTFNESGLSVIKFD